jgi:hypothetical protein
VNNAVKKRVEFGDFQTPDNLAADICNRLVKLGVKPEVIIEPTCGVGAFLLAANDAFPEAKEVHGFEINGEYLDTLSAKLESKPHRITLTQADFFKNDWQKELSKTNGSILVIGNFPWVTNATQGSIGGKNLPAKSNFQGHAGFDAISGKSNFDISEWMLLETLKWFKRRSGCIAMLVKTAVARKVLSQAAKLEAPIEHSYIVKINAKEYFDASVEACLLVIQLAAESSKASYDYMVFDSLKDTEGKKVGHRLGLTVGDLEVFNTTSFLLGTSPQKWRSGIKHDLSSVMELTHTENGFINGLGETVQLEAEYLYPLLKGSDIGSNKGWRSKYVIVTQQKVGEDTHLIEQRAPKTWAYLLAHSTQLDSRGSIIYKKNPRFSIFGVGDYAFKPWRIAICSLYKNLNFKLVPPRDGKPVMFDDTVYYLSFDSEVEARLTLDKLTSRDAMGLLDSLIFWDDKRPIKTSILNLLDWSQLVITQKQAS